MRIFNKKARFDYEILRHIETGVVLTGAEARAVRESRADLTGSFARVVGGEVYLINAAIPVAGLKDYDPRRTRKLLLHKSEIVTLMVAQKQGKLTIVPISVYNKGRRVKLEIALARTKKQFEKKRTIKERDITRDLERELK